MSEQDTSVSNPLEKLIADTTRTALTQAYDLGYAAGKEAGYSDGFKDGEETGYSDGFVDGKEAGYSDGFKDGEETGYSDGIVDGSRTGFVTGMNTLTPAVSDGLRHGSSECGKALQGLKSMRDTPPNPNGKSD